MYINKSLLENYGVVWMEYTVNQIKKRIIIKLVRWKKWGGYHTENILKGLPTHLRGHKFTKQALKELINDGWIIPAKKTGEIHYSLNPEKTDEILQFCQKLPC